MCLFELLTGCGRVNGHQDLTGLDGVARVCADGQYLALDVLAQFGAGLGSRVAVALDVGLEVSAAGDRGLDGGFGVGLSGFLDYIHTAANQTGQNQHGQTNPQRLGELAVGLVHRIGIPVADGSGILLRLVSFRRDILLVHRGWIVGHFWHGKVSSHFFF